MANNALYVNEAAYVKYFADINRCGFINQTDTSISFNDSTYVFTLSAVTSSWSYYRAGLKYTIFTNQTITLAGSPPTAGTYYITINSTDGTLSSGQTIWTLTDSTIPVAIIVWDSTKTPKYQLADERHSILIDVRDHKYLHETRGTQFVSGGVLTGPTLQVSTYDSGNTFGVSSTVIADEDIYETLSALTQPDGTTLTYNVYYRTNSTGWTWMQSEVPFKYTGSGYIEYDNSGTTTSGTTGQYYNSYLLFTHQNLAARFSIISGRAQFSSVANAQAESPVNFDFTGFPVYESVIAYQFTWGTNSGYSTKGKCRLEATPVKIEVSANASVVTGAGVEHDSLSGLQGGTSGQYYHLTSTDYTTATGISSSLSSEISTRSSVDASLSAAIANTDDWATHLAISQILVYDGTTITGTTNLFPSLSSVLSSEISIRTSVDLSLSAAIIANAGGTGVTSLSTVLSSEISARTSNDLSLSTAISTVSSSATSLSSVLSSEISVRTSGDLSLSTAISTVSSSATSLSSVLSSEISVRTSQVTSLSSVLSSEISVRTSSDLSLSTAISTVSSSATSLSSVLSSEISVRTSGDLSLSTAISTVSSSATSLSSVLSSEISVRTSGDLSLSTAISTVSSSATSLSSVLSSEISVRTSQVTSLSSVLSSEISVRTSADLSLSTAISTVSSSATSLSTALSSEISVRTSVEASMSTALVTDDITTHLSTGQLLYYDGSTISGTTNLFPSLSSALSSEISVRGSQVTSLSTALGSISPTMALSGLTDVSLTNLTYYDMLYYSGTTWKNTPNLWTQSNSAVTLYNDSYDLSLSNIQMTDDGGVLILADMSISTGVTVGTEESYSFNLNGNSILRIYEIASGTTGSTNTGIVLDGKYYYLGEPTANGSWRFYINSSGELEFDKYTGGTWTYNSKFTFNTTSSTTTGIATNSFQISGASYSSIVITGITSGTTTLGANNQNLVTEQAIKNYADSVGGGTGTTSLSTALSSEISVRASSVTSLSTSIISISSALSSEISVRSSQDTSLSTAISSVVNATGTTTSVSQALSTEMSVRASVDTSLSSAVAAGGGTGTTSLSSALSSEISIRASQDTSLSTAIVSAATTAAYSGLTYNLVSGGTLSTTGTTTINFSTTDMYTVDLSGNTTTGITFSFTNGITGKTLTMVITNSGGGNTTGCVFDGTACKTFGTYTPSKTNAVSVICVRGTNPSYWVTIASV